MTCSASSTTARVGRGCTRVASVLHMGKVSNGLYGCGKASVGRFLFVDTSSALGRFFPCAASRNDLRRILAAPSGITMGGEFTRRLFKGRSNVKRVLRVVGGRKRDGDCGMTTVLRSHPRSFLRFSLLAKLSSGS